MDKPSSQPLGGASDVARDSPGTVTKLTHPASTVPTRAEDYFASWLAAREAAETDSSAAVAGVADGSPQKLTEQSLRPHHDTPTSADPSKIALAAVIARGASAIGYEAPQWVSAAAELPPPPLPRDRAAERQRRAVSVAPPGRVERAELAAQLNIGHGDRVQKHIVRSREHVEDLEAAEQLAPNRGQRPVAKADAQRTSIHREARIMMQAIVNSRGGYVIQSYLHRLRPIFSGQPLAALRDAALCPQPQGGCRWTYADECARRRIAIGLMFLICGRWTNQRTAFGSRSSRRGLLVAGMSVDRIVRAATPVGRKPYDRHTFSSRTNDGWLGDMAHFERAGFAIRKRLPAARCNPWEIGTSGQAKNRYWIGCVVSTRSQKDERRNRPVTSIGEALGIVQFDPRSHHAGWEWATEVIAYAPKLTAAAAPA